MFCRWASAFGLFGLAAVFTGSCGGSETGSSSSQQASGTTSSTSSGGGGSGGAGGATFGCDPACTPPQVCSAANTCIEPGQCGGDSDCEPGTICSIETKLCVPGGRSADEIVAKAVPPNMLIVLDRSCSMTNAVGGSTKWAIAVAALNKMTADFNGKIRFGMTLFPDLVGGDCGQAAIPIPVADAKETAIQDLLTKALVKADPYFPDGPCVTNIDTAILQASLEPAFTAVDRDSYAVLVSDGKQSAGCGGDVGDKKTEMYIADLFAKGVPTFVIGFAVGVDNVQMDKFATAGGVPASGATKFYDAADQASLDAALKTIATKTLSCSYALATKPPSPDEIYVFLNDKKVLKDTTHTSGWDYDAATNQVVFYGQSCDDLKNGVVDDIDIVLGCDAPQPN
ncbi:MAG: vWA domain-containing protein [Byssovorax sp.]